MRKKKPALKQRSGFNSLVDPEPMVPGWAPRCDSDRCRASLVEQAPHTAKGLLRLGRLVGGRSRGSRRSRRGSRSRFRSSRSATTIAGRSRGATARVAAATTTMTTTAAAAIVRTVAAVATVATTHTVAAMTNTSTTAATARRGTTAIGSAVTCTTAATMTGHCRLLTAQQGDSDNREEDRDAQN